MVRIKEEKECRICKGELERVLDLGNIYPSSFLKYDDKVSEDMKAPLILDRCKECGLVQLEHTIDSDLMYRQYWYASSLNKSMVASLQDVVNDVTGRITLNKDDAVLDIGCNDGTMLRMFPNNTLRIGYDPAVNIERSSDFAFVNEYFTGEEYFNVFGFPKAKIITAIAMFYDLPDPHKFVEDVKEVLSDDGIFIIQFTDLLSMIKLCAFDNICHEHLEYYRLKDVENILRQHGMQVYDVSYNDVNGGSVRITACHADAYPAYPSVQESLDYEEEYLKEHDMDYFREIVEVAKDDVRLFLQLAKYLNSKVFLMGASTKGNTLLQVCGITKEDIPFAAEVNKDKFGLYTAGSDIYIIPEHEALSMKPDFFMVPVWHFEKNLVRNPKIREYINNGGRLAFPLPVFHIIDKDNLEDD